MGEITLAYGQPINFDLTFHVGKIDQNSDAIADESFGDGEKISVIDGNFYCGIGTASSSGGIARSDVVIKEAKIDLGFTSVPVDGEGNGSFAGLQGYILVAGVPKITITGQFNASYWTELEGSNTSQYIELCQGTTALTTPAFGFWMPNAYLDPETPPVVDFTGEKIVEATAVYLGSNAGYNSETDNDESGAAPWYLAISGDGS